MAGPEAILALVEQATEAVGVIRRGDVGHLRVGITPPAGPVIAPHLTRCFAASTPEVSVEIQRMWLPSLGAALHREAIDVAITYGDLGSKRPDIATAEVGSEQLLIGLRPDHPLANQASVDLHRLTDRTLGMHPAHLFPAWHAVQRQILAQAGLAPAVVELNDTDLSARRWIQQPEIDWIMLTGSLLAPCPQGSRT